MINILKTVLTLLGTPAIGKLMKQGNLTIINTVLLSICLYFLWEQQQAIITQNRELESIRFAMYYKLNIDVNEPNGGHRHQPVNSSNDRTNPPIALVSRLEDEIKWKGK